MSNRSKIAIIGSGLSGLVAAQNLKDDFDVVVFEKARGVGGRMSTRRADPYQFDHGAQYFTARSPEFQKFLKPHIQSGLVQDWESKIVTLEKGEKSYKREWFEPHYVCSPRMNSLCKHLEFGLTSHFSVEVVELVRQCEKWNLLDKAGDVHQGFDWVIMSIPSHQAITLLPDDFNDLDLICKTQMTGCYSTMLGFDVLPKLNWGIAMPKDSFIGWMAVNSAKPDRETAPSILIQTTNEWADEYMDADVLEMEDVILQEFFDLTGVLEDSVVHKTTHRWKYANTSVPAGKDFFLDKNYNIGVCGDWCIKGRVESAFISAYQLSQAINKL